MKNWLDLHEPYKYMNYTHFYQDFPQALWMYNVVKNYYDGQVNKKCAHAKE